MRDSVGNGVGEPGICGQPEINAIRREDTMSWSELERLVEEAEGDGVIRRGLRHCRSRRELLLAAQRLGYDIGSADLHQAWELHHQECMGEVPTDRSVPDSAAGSQSHQPQSVEMLSVEPQSGEPLPLAA